MPHLFLLLFAAVLVLPLLMGKVLYWGDIGLYFAPMSTLQREILLQNHLPLWNPLILGGQPFVGNPQMGWLYPTSWLLPFVSTGTYLTLVCWLHLLLAGEWTWLYLRNRRMSIAASLVGAMTFMGCDAVVGRLQFPPMLMAVVYLPLILFAIDRILDYEDWWTYPLLTLAITLCLLAAHAQVTYLILLTVSLYALLRVLSKPRPDHIPTASRLLLCGLFALSLALPYLLPVVELLRHSPREALSASGVDRFVVEPRHLLNFLVPHFTGHPANGDYWGGGNAWEPACFVGWLSPVFALYVARHRARSRSVRFWVVFALLTLWLSFGASGGLFLPAYYLVPGISLFHDPARFLILTSFAFAVLAAFGVDYWLRQHQHTRRHSAAAIVGTALPLALFAPQWNPAINPKKIDKALATSQKSVIPYATYFFHSERIWDPIITEGYMDYGTDDLLAVRRQFSSFLPNATMFAHEITQQGYEPVAVADAVGMDALVRRTMEQGEPHLPDLLKGRGISLLRLPPMASYYHPQSDLGNGWRIVRKLRRVDGGLRITNALCDLAFNAEREAIVSDDFPTPWKNTDVNEPSESEEEQAHIAPSLQSPNRWSVKISRNRRQGALITPLTYFPGWRCVINGKPAPVYRANMASMGVVVPAGNSVVVFTYRPAALIVGLYFGGVAWCAFAAWTVSLCLKHLAQKRNR